MSSTTSLAANTPAEKRLLWLVRDLVAQGCTDTSKPVEFDGPIPVFSEFIGVYAEAIALLAEYALVTDLTDNGGRVVSANLLPVGETAQVLKTGPFRPKDEPLRVESEIGDNLG